MDRLKIEKDIKEVETSLPSTKTTCQGIIKTT
jgi:hypothetical protein